MKNAMISNPAAVKTQNRAEMKPRAPWSRPVEGVVKAAVIIYLAARLMAPVPAHATEPSTANQPPANQPVATSTVGAEPITAPAPRFPLLDFNDAAIYRLAQTTHVGKGDGHQSLLMRFREGTFNMSELYTVAIGQDGRATFQLNQSGNQFDGAAYLGVTGNGRTLGASISGSNQYGLGYYENAGDIRYGLGYSFGSRDTITGGTDLVLGPNLHFSVRDDFTFGTGPSSNSCKIGFSTWLNNNWQAGVAAKIGDGWTNADPVGYALYRDGNTVIRGYFGNNSLTILVDVLSH
jgi:hypothetical protein